jgi:hypothetical protein
MVGPELFNTSKQLFYVQATGSDLTTYGFTDARARVLHSKTHERRTGAVNFGLYSQVDRGRQQLVRTPRRLGEGNHPGDSRDALTFYVTAVRT